MATTGRDERTSDLKPHGGPAARRLPPGEDALEHLAWRHGPSRLAEGREQGVRITLLGRLDELPPATRASIESALAATAGGDRLRLNIAFNYAGRTELVDAIRRIVRSSLPPEAIDESTVSAALYTAGLPDPDLVIRTGGEQRLSNFLIWQAAYAELVSTDTLWPDFGPAELDGAIAEYASRSRRYGR